MAGVGAGAAAIARRLAVVTTTLGVLATLRAVVTTAMRLVLTILRAGRAALRALWLTLAIVRGRAGLAAAVRTTIAVRVAALLPKIGRASCRGRGLQCVMISVVAVSLTKTKSSSQ